jgi:hypothetical protein
VSDTSSIKRPKAGRKKALILEYRATHRLERAGLAEIRAIEAELRLRLGTGSKTSVSYVASVLSEAGTRVELPAGFDDRYVDPAMEEPYASRLSGALHFGDLELTEAALRKLDEFYREYRKVSDRRGTNLVRSLVVKGKQRAESLARNPRVSLEKRREKQEIASWFRVWLEVPDLFFDWLDLRKQSEEFRRMFAKDNDRADARG